MSFVTEVMLVPNPLRKTTGWICKCFVEVWMFLAMEDMLVPNTSVTITDWICEDFDEISMRSIALEDMLVADSWRRFTG